MKIIIKILLYILFLMWSSVTSGEEPSSDMKEDKLESSESKESEANETMVVTGSKTEQLVEKSPDHERRY